MIWLAGLALIDKHIAYFSGLVPGCIEGCGLCYRNWPKMQEGKLATVHYLLHTVTVSIALSLLYIVLSNMDLAPKFAPVMDMILMGTYASVILFAYLFFTRARE